MKPTIYDIARYSDVSIATVSKVLNGTGRISQATRERVLSAIDVLGYERSLIATALAGKNTYTIGCLVPDVSNPFFSEIVRGAEDAAYDCGYSLLVCNTGHNPERETVYLRTLRQKRMDGLVIATGSTPREVIADLMQEGTRVVLLARGIPDTQAAMVSVDNYRGGYLAGKHLVDLGHRRIGVVSEPLDLESSRERLRGFADALAEVHATYVMAPEGGFGIAAGGEMARCLLQQTFVTALFAGNDQLAVGALQTCRELGKQVPADISLVGFDDTILARIVDPPLTSVAQPMQELGRRTLEVLIEAIEAQTQPGGVMALDPTLVVRGSTREISNRCPS